MLTLAPLPDIADVTIATQGVVHDLSLWSLFLSADIVVKLIMIGLMLASFWSWTIIFSKIIHIKTLFKSTTKFESSFWSGGSLDALSERIGTQPRDPMSAIFIAAMREWKRSGNKSRPSVTLADRIERAMQITLTREMDKLDRHMSFLGTLASIAPFIGLFGTVWGIMNSFQSIASSQNTNLAVVAPGIAEALFATALGLVAAIPAGIAYNKFSFEINRYINRLESFSSEFGAIIARQIEEGQ